MLRLFTSLTAASVLTIVLGPSTALYADEETLVEATLEHGVSILYPASLARPEDEHGKTIEQEAGSRAGASGAALLFLATSNEETMDQFVAVTAMPPEVSQAELKTFDAQRRADLQAFFFQAAEAEFQNRGIRVTKKYPPVVRAGDQLSYFLWAFDYTEADDQQRVSLRAIYYTLKARYMVTISCTKEYFTAHSDLVKKSLSSLRLANPMPVEADVTSGQAGTSTNVTKEDHGAIMKLADQLRTAVLSNDFTALIDLMHPELVQASGGRKKLVEILRTEEEKNKLAGMIIHSMEISPPEHLHIGSTFRLTFLPTNMDMTISGTRGRSRSFQIAFSQHGTKDWHLIDGTRMTEERFQAMFTGLPKSVKLPPVVKDLE